MKNKRGRRTKAEQFRGILNTRTDQAFQSFFNFSLVYLAHRNLSVDDFVLLGILTTIQFTSSGLMRAYFLERAKIVESESFNLERFLCFVSKRLLFINILLLIVLGISSTLEMYFFSLCIMGLLGILCTVNFEMRRNLRYIIGSQVSNYLIYILISNISLVYLLLIDSINLLYFLQIVYVPIFVLEMYQYIRKGFMNQRDARKDFQIIFRSGKQLGLATIVSSLSSLFLIPIFLSSGAQIYSNLRLCQNFISPIGFLQKIRYLSLFEKIVQTNGTAGLKTITKCHAFLLIFFGFSISFFFLHFFTLTSSSILNSSLLSIYLIIVNEVFALIFAKNATYLRIFSPRIVLKSVLITFFLTILFLLFSLSHSNFIIPIFLALKTFVYLFFFSGMFGYKKIARDSCD